MIVCALAHVLSFPLEGSACFCRCCKLLLHCGIAFPRLFLATVVGVYCTGRTSTNREGKKERHLLILSSLTTLYVETVAVSRSPAAAVGKVPESSEKKWESVHVWSAAAVLSLSVCLPPLSAQWPYKMTASWEVSYDIDRPVCWFFPFWFEEKIV